MKAKFVLKGGEGSGNFRHAGRPGQVGGSLSINHKLFLTRDYNPETDNKPYRNSGIISQFVEENTFSYDENPHYILPKEYEKLTEAHSENIKAVQRAVMFQPFMSSWAGSHVIESASRVFDIPLNDFEKARIDKWDKQRKATKKRDINNDYKANGFSFEDRPLNNEQMDALVKAVYAKTQKIFRDEGISEITVYRGGDTQEIGNNVLTSWTIDPDVAKGFGGTVLSKTVPVSQVFAIPASGFGVSKQLEVILLKK